MVKFLLDFWPNDRFNDIWDRQNQIDTKYGSDFIPTFKKEDRMAAKVPAE